MSYKPVGITESSIFPPRVENRITKGTTDPYLLTQRALNSLGGVIGTDGKPAICLRVDDWHDHLKGGGADGLGYAKKFQDRGLPWGHASLAKQGAQPWFTVATFEDERAWVKAGAEVWSHGTDHKDPRLFDGQFAEPVPGTPNGMYEQIVGSKALIEAENIKCKGWMNPGPTNAFPPEAPYWPDANLKWSDYDSLAGRLILGTYGFSSGFQTGAPSRILPNRIYHGHNHYTVLTAGLEWATVEGVINNFADGNYAGMGMELLIHTAYVENQSPFTEAQYDAMLDLVKSLWDAGVIEVVTPAGLMAADPTTSFRLDLIRNGDVSNLNPADPKPWTMTAGTTVTTSGSDTYFHVASGAGANIPIRNLDDQDLNGETWLFDGWARSGGSGATVASVKIPDPEDTGRLNVSKTFTIPTGPTWTRVRFPFGTLLSTNQIRPAIGRSSGDATQWKSAHIYKV